MSVEHVDVDEGRAKPGSMDRSALLAALMADEKETVELSEEEEAALPLFEFNQAEILSEFKDAGESYAVKMRRARKDEHEAKEYASRTLKTTKRVASEMHVSTVNQYTKGLVVLAKMVALEVQGYGDTPEEWLPADLVLSCSDESLVGKRKAEVGLRSLPAAVRESLSTVVDRVPASHLKFCGDDYFGGRFKLVRPKGRRIVTKNVAREWQVLHQVGVYDQPDGTRSKPTHVLRYFFEDAPTEAISLFDSKAIVGPTILADGGDQREERYISVETMEKLFNFSLKRVTGGCVDGVAFSVTDKAHLAAIDFNIKRQVSLLYFNGLAVDRGNS
jgi:hypothetical protein